MIALKECLPNFTPEEYFAWEELQLERHEYIDGKVYGMSGGTVDHGNIAGNFLALLKVHLRGSGCRTLNSDCRVAIVEAAKYVYPDLSVTCDERDRVTSQYITYPCLVVEVLSPGTEAYDRGQKFKMYRRNPCLQEYVLVSVDVMEIELFRRTEGGDWRIINYQEGDVVELRSVGFSCRIEEVYDDVLFNLPISPGVTEDFG
ncbi:Uma2 family endonuclease [Spirulina sp. CCNP1310]|uniref:Uma2 family endonuclease n=1 Tax=Spirulina sp. CCNP1310 TaxID=3110249 RepID=UPI002B21B892|nr:Uma2 family endonuclease [Spirulina sp. CCNP1310]MEA5419292.1 Uma2 family endonuclease [Spirulina sp. CCNP1310]